MNQQRTDRSISLQNYGRRKILKVLSTASAALLFGWDRSRLVPNSAEEMTSGAAAAALPACVIRPEQTEGPYFADVKLNRSDIRADPSDNLAKPGVPLRLEFHLSRVMAASCIPLTNATVDIWHCDGLGVYSNVRDSNFDTRGKKFLRGYQTTNGAGIAEFLTIYPGWYEGRAVHIHFKIRADAAPGRAHEFTSQLYFDEAITEQIHQQAPYNRKGRRTTMNEADFIFRRGGKQLLLVPVKNVQGYSAKFDIGMQLS